MKSINPLESPKTPFDEDIWLSSHNELTMNLSEGWSMGPETTLRVFSSANQPGPARVNGGALSFQGHLLTTSSNKQVEFNAPVTLAATASGELGPDAIAAFNASATVNGGPWLLDSGADIDFNGPTVVAGGDVITHSALPGDGAIDFNGATTWNGHLTVVGVARQIGSASVSGPSSIDVTRFDMDGNGSTAWSIGNALTVDASYIDTGRSNIFDGGMTSSGTFLGKLTMNLQPPSTHWTMNGTMNLGGVGAIMLTRVSGSEMRVTGDLNINGHVQITADTVLRDGAIVTMQTAASTLRLSATSFIEPDAAIIGTGMLEVGASGDLTLVHPSWRSSIGLLNTGVLKISASVGVGSASGFQNGSSGTWIVDIGGYVPGVYHDHLTVVSGTAELDGTLDVRVIDAGLGLFQPQVGDSFTILTAPTVNGTFDDAPVSFVPGKVYLWSVITAPSTVAVQLDQIVPCPADLNGDGVIDGADLGLLLASWGECGGCAADINFDGPVDGADLGMLLASWGACQSSTDSQGRTPS